jgi:hypothetical protein
MSGLCDELRPFWLLGIHRVGGRQRRGLTGLLAQRGYQVYKPASGTAVELRFAEWFTVPGAFAFDCARMSTAALETFEGISPSSGLPKTAGWLVIRTYYGAFFAAHAIARMLGTSVTQLDAAAVNAIDTVTALFSMQPAGGLQKGLYVCVADAHKQTLSFSKITADGSHEALWSEFGALVRNAIQRILTGSSVSLRAQRAAAKLIEIEAALTDGGSLGKSSWLSVMRNRVNYQHGYGVWFPYQPYPAYYDALHDKAANWDTDPDKHSIWPRPGRELQRFVETATMLMALCRDMCLDMANRHPDNDSFHQYGSLALINRLAAA